MTYCTNLKIPPPCYLKYCKTIPICIQTWILFAKREKISGVCFYFCSNIFLLFTNDKIQIYPFWYFAHYFWCKNHIYRPITSKFFLKNPFSYYWSHETYCYLQHLCKFRQTLQEYSEFYFIRFPLPNGFSNMYGMACYSWMYSML